MEEGMYTLPLEEPLYVIGMTISTSNDPSNAKSSRYYFGDLIEEGDGEGCFLGKDSDGNLIFVNEGEITTLVLDPDTKLDDVISFLRLVWSSIPRLDSGEFFDTIIEEYM